MSGEEPDALTAVVRYTLSPHTTGDEWASPGTGVRHARPAFVSRFHETGIAFPSAIPLAPGPRKRGQFVPGASEANAAATSGQASKRAAGRRIGILRSMDWMPH